MISNNFYQQRAIRVFISSTFRDMQAERDELVKYTFPQLRALCESRGVVWGEVDLRWGITDEEKAEGKVLPLCLEEIKNCRPYFIGLLGERYGWVPDEIPADIIEREPWLKEHLNRSVTELEILHGVLNNPEADHAFFYFRDPSYIEKLPEGQRNYFIEEKEEHKQKLQLLKDKIRRSEFPLRENYPNPKTFGKLVLKDMTSVIDKLFPEGSSPDSLDRDAADHEQFANSRAAVYIGRQTNFEILDRHVNSSDQPLVILGESGSGKSALLSTWALKYKEEHPDELLIMHFIGASPYSADWMAMLRRIMGESKRHFNLPEDIPSKPDELKTAFANWLHMVSVRGKAVLILDALNQLEDKDAAPNLVWIPPFIPENIRMIVSTLPGRPLDEISRRNWVSITVEPLDINEKKELITEYLMQYSKKLTAEHMDIIANASQTANPLFLRALLEELRLYGDHFTIDERIKHYLETETIDDLYGKILERYEEDYERDRPGLVRDSMSLLWAARRGLSETELMELLGSEGLPLPKAYWAPLYLASKDSLLSRSGLINFSHDYFRRAVHTRYLFTENKETEAHLCLSEYFVTFDSISRLVDELPWQLTRAKEWEWLKDLLSQPEFFEFAWQYNYIDVMYYWSQLEDNSYSKIAAYQYVLDKPEELDDDFVFDIGELFNDTGHILEALLLSDYQIKRFREIGNKESLCKSLNTKAIILSGCGEFETAMKLFKETESISLEIGGEKWLSLSIVNQANILSDHGEFKKAMKLYQEVECICRKRGYKDYLQNILCNQARIFYFWGKLDEAMNLYKESENICREIGDNLELSDSIGYQADIVADLGKLGEALMIYEEQEIIYRKLGYKEGLQRNLNNRAGIFYVWGKLDEAMSLYKESESICKEIGDKNGLSMTLNNQAVIFADTGDTDEAIKVHKASEHIFRELGDKKNLSGSLNNQALILEGRGELDEAMRLYKESESICRELGHKNGLQISLCNQGNIFAERGEIDEAMKLYKEEERLCRELRNNEGLSTSLYNQATIIAERGEFDEAMKLYKDSENICRELKNYSVLVSVLTNMGELLTDKMGKPQEALPLIEEAYNLAKDNDLNVVAQKIKPILESVISKVNE